MSNQIPATKEGKGGMWRNKNIPSSIIVRLFFFSWRRKEFVRIENEKKSLSLMDFFFVRSLFLFLLAHFEMI